MRQTIICVEETDLNGNIDVCFFIAFVHHAVTQKEQHMFAHTKF
jgi:hypothetical protein